MIVGDLAGITDITWIPLIKLELIKGSSKNVLEAFKTCKNIAFTSPRAIRILLDDARNQNILEELLRALSEAFIAVIGHRTGREVKEVIGREPDYIASKHYGKDMIVELHRVHNIDCLITPRSTEGVRELNEKALELGVRLFDISLYKPNPLWDNVILAGKTITEGSIDIVLLSSPMIAKLLCTTLNIHNVKDIKFIAMGETTLKNIPGTCLEQSKIITGDGSIETIKSIMKSIC